MKRSLKWLSLLLTGVLGVTVLSGCGKSNVANTASEAYVMDENLNPPGKFPVNRYSEECIGYRL